MPKAGFGNSFHQLWLLVLPTFGLRRRIPHSSTHASPPISARASSTAYLASSPATCDATDTEGNKYKDTPSSVRAWVLYEYIN